MGLIIFFEFDPGSAWTFSKYIKYASY